MSVPRDDRLPAPHSPNVRRMLGELDSTSRWPEPRLRVRRRGCGCWLASVFRLPSGDLMLAARRSLVHVATDRRQARSHRLAWDVADPPADFAADELGCKHGIPVLDVGTLRAAVAAVPHPGAIHFL